MEGLSSVMSRLVEPLHILRDELAGLLVALVALIPNLIAAIVAIAITWLAVRLLGRLAARGLRRSRMRPSLQRAIVSLEKISLWTVGLLLAATLLLPNLTPTKLLAGLGLGSIAIGLAFKDIFDNFLSGILILVRKPMQIGDDIECEGVSGRVEEITIRDTYLRKRSGELVLVPNSFLFKNPIKVLTDWPKRRIELAVGVTYDQDLATAHRVIDEAMAKLRTVDHERRVDVFVTAFGDSSIDFLVRWWTDPTPYDEHHSRDEAAMAIKAAFDAAGIDIPFPQRTLTFGEPLALDRGAGPAHR
jgi:small-conductance mechanosensitive channel